MPVPTPISQGLQHAGLQHVPGADCLGVLTCEYSSIFKKQKKLGHVNPGEGFRHICFDELELASVSTRFVLHVAGFALHVAGFSERLSTCTTCTQTAPACPKQRYLAA